MKLLTALTIVASVSLISAADAARSFNPRFGGAHNLGLIARGIKPTTTGPAFEWYEEAIVNHFALPEKTSFFRQRYITNMTFYKPGGPIFLLVGGEGPISVEGVTGHFYINELARKYSGGVVSLEHRGYGESPLWKDDAADVQFVDSRQSVLDHIRFAQWFTATKLSDPNAPWIAVGGSYSGSLAAWIVSAAESTFVGGLASSAPLVAGDFPQYFDVVANSIGGQAPGGSVRCVSLLAQGLEAANALYADANGRNVLTNTFRTCAPVKEGSLEQASFFDALTGLISFVVQYNNDNRGSFPNVDAMCGVAIANENAAEPLAALAAVQSWLNNVTGATCTDVSWNGVLESVKEAGAARSWTYQTCNEFSFFQYGGQSGALHVPLSFNRDFYNMQCGLAFSISAREVNANFENTNNFYGEKDAVSWARNLFLTNGKVDPWHYLGVNTTSLLPVASVRGVETRLMDTTAHCADMYAASSNDPRELILTRGYQSAAVSRWLNARLNKNGAH